MSAAEAPPAWPPGAVYWSPDSYGFQLDGMARAWILRQMMIVWDMGIGKSHLGLAMAGYGFEFGEADLVLIICKKNKLREWCADLEEFTSIRDYALYHGPRRQKKLESSPRLLVTTYEAIRSDAVQFVTSRKLADGPLMGFLRGKRIIVIYDEIAKLGNRGSGLYKAHQYVLAQLRKEHPDMRVYGMTGTPIERDWENAFNEFRLVWPQGMPTVSGFEEMCVSKRILIPTGKGPYSGFEKIIWSQDGVRQFTALCAPRLLRKRKTDADVRDQFSPLTEEFVRCEMRPDQAGIYRLLEDLAWEGDGSLRNVPGLPMMLRLLAGHPRAILASARNGRSKLAMMLAQEMGPDLERCSSTKTEELTDILDRVVIGQGDKAMVFTFFAETVLPSLAGELRDRYPLFIYDGKPGSEHAKDQFRSCDGGAVLLCSDAASDGINVPETGYIIEYDLARMHSVRSQRFGRGHRLGRTRPLSCLTLLAESTVETFSTVGAVMDRNEQQDIFLGDENADGHLTADERREMFSMARRRRAGKS